MSTKIEWCTETWNPIVGCTKVSAGCDNCYAEKMAYRLAAMAIKNIVPETIGKYVRVIKGRKWDGTCILDDISLLKPLSWRKPRMIFICSMGDLFHPNVERWWIDEVIRITTKCPQHIFLILTKRPERMRYYFKTMQVIPSNIWIGVTAENQEQANIRVPLLLSTPATKRFVSVEPMLEQIDLVNVFGNGHQTTDEKQLGFIDWVICGGESGPGARPMPPEGGRFLQSVCHCAGVPFFFKQWGEWLPSYDFGERMEELIKNFPKCRIGKDHVFEDGIHMYKVGKKAAGSLLDGKLYKEYPKS